MMTARMMPVAANNDAELVSASLSGNRDAFGQIVARYQSLVCSLAYSATGSLSQSEDLAQETFVTAWKQLAGLREPEKLRAWLCGIARNLIHNSLRKQGREPSHQAESLEKIAEKQSPEPLPVERAISNEEQAILWRSLERIPEIYREPLVLFYREHQSVDAVAANLELTEDAVKQRLSRGRKLLHEQVLAFVEGALARTAPGRNFTLGVIAALPLAVTSAKAAAVGTTLAKGGAAAKSAATLGSLGGLFVMLGGIYIGLRAQADDTKSPREREFMRWMIGVRMVVALLTVAGFVLVRKMDVLQQPMAHGIAFAAFFFICTVIGTQLLDYSIRRQRQIQIEDGTLDEAEWTKPRWKTEPLLNPANGTAKSNHLLKAARFMAFPLIFVVYLLVRMPAQSAQKVHLGSLGGILFFAVAFLLMSFGGWRQRPRYQKPKLGWRIGLAFGMAAITLLMCNSPQSGFQVAGVTSPTVTMIFNAVVVLAYAAFAGFLWWKNRADAKSTTVK
jgi:RNA polymerase sigma factor (sigma-70 family)